MNAFSRCQFLVLTVQHGHCCAAPQAPSSAHGAPALLARMKVPDSRLDSSGPRVEARPAQCGGARGCGVRPFAAGTYVPSSAPVPTC